MVKLALSILTILFLLVGVSQTMAASWSVTVTWTRSVGPNLASEQALYNAAVKCTVLPAAPTTCNFTIPDLSGSVSIKSINSQGGFAETALVPLQVVPAPATGVIVNVTFIP
jgi:hypothetical protein